MPTPRLGRASANSLGAFGRDRRGNIAVLGALLLMPLCALGGGAADYARSQGVRAELQDALDGAVLAGAKASNSPTVAAAAFKIPASTGVEVDTPVFTKGEDGSLHGSVTARTATAFLSIAGIPQFSLRLAASAASRAVQNDVCLTGFGVSGPGVARQGSGDIVALGCRFDIRSTAVPAAVYGSRGGDIAAADICVRGTVTYGTPPATARHGCTLERPANLRPAAPAVGACTAANTNVTVMTRTTAAAIQPGTYCGPLVLDGAGALTMNPGVYVFRSETPNGPAGFTYWGTGSLKAGGVFLFFASPSTLDLSGSGDISLTPPTAGAHQGVLMHEVPGLPLTDVYIHHSQRTFLQGVIHLPSRNFFVRGSGNAVADEVSLMVNSLSTSGSGTWTFKPAPLSAADVGTTPRLKS